MVVTISIKTDIETEVDKAVETHAKSINEENCNKIYVFRKHRGVIIWSVKTCDKCYRPTLVHADPWEQTCSVLGEPVPQKVVAEYIDQLNNHKRLKQIVAWVIPDKKQFYKIKDDIPSPPQRNRRNNSHSKSYNTDKDLETNNSDEADTLEDDLQYPEDRYYTYKLEANLHDCEESEDEDDNESEYDKDDKEEYPEFKRVDEYVNQNPKWRDHVIDLLSLHPDSLQKFLETEQKLGRFKPRDLTQEPRQQQSVWRQPSAVAAAVGTVSRRSYQQQ
jgi:hypothetical protein